MTDKIDTYNKISEYNDIKIEEFDVTKRYTKPHKHNKYLEIVYFIKGAGFHHVDLKSYKIKPATVFVIKRDEVHHWEITTKPKGYVIIIKEDFLQKTLDKFINYQLLKLQHKSKIKLTKKDISLNALFKSLAWEKKQEVVNREAIEGGLKALFSKLVAYAQVKKVESTDLVLLFTNILSHTLKNNVNFYAENLNTTSQNLNAICRKEYAKSASDIIADHIIKEVKRRLLYTNEAISDIAYSLEFKDTSHFTKYFKRYVGETPKQFKLQNKTT
ncbi:AraC family transcriptional regulator [Polaribacter sp. Z014]|uniref:helix-turn-helix domain-containing protein n=1 Tax=unclassified Polaribacter TaxID=196858 RepID=UPI00193C1D60|nr:MULTISPECIES: AraC family transcriptional regulator [unclassified Polaribacter]MCL7765257.1 AraC family transcriptional regulator [Polaribacter sp. Z014]QVY65924.1 helix-turn-helix domain-containing protein [Polaribacter sp. Q13]